MIIKHLGIEPQIDESSYIAPTATICGDVRIGKNSRIMHGATVVAEGGSIEIGDSCIILENAVIRSNRNHSTRICNNVLVGPGSHIVGAMIHDNVFIATHASIFHGSELRKGSEVRINAVVHIKTVIEENQTVPIGWVAVGNPASIFPPDKHDEIWAIQEGLNFPDTVYNVSRELGDRIMPEITKRVSDNLKEHFSDEIVE